MIAALEHFAPHQEELRKRLIRCFLVIGITTGLSYCFIDTIAKFCLQPLFTAYPPLTHLVYTKLTDAFISYIKLSFLCGILVSFPVILYQVWMFVAPGLLNDEKKLARQIISWSSLLFLSGGLFAFFIVLPKTLAYFMSYAGPNLEPMPKLGIYLTFIARMIMAFGIAFEIPFLMVMITRANLINRNHFRKKRKHFYIAIIIVSFLLTAGDFVATGLLAFPLFALYEAGLILCRFFSKNKDIQKSASNYTE
jgi:sec-independent protein translocase protein TatC